MARPVGRVERAAKWVKRSPLVAALLALVLLSVLVGASGVCVKYLDAREQEGIAQGKAQEALDALRDRDVALRQAREDAGAARKSKTLAEERERETQYQLATSNVLLAQLAWDSNNAAVARQRLAANAHPLLGQRQAAAEPTWQFELDPRLQELPRRT